MPLSPDTVVEPKEETPTEPLVPFTCPWAQDGLRKAMEGMSGPSSGVESYHIGTRGLSYRDAAAQAKVVDYWMKMVEFYCGTDALPPAITGRDSAVRIVMRDV